jgi:hypothetical protein
MDTVFLIGCFGAIGGITRGIVGLLKALSSRERINCLYFSITIIISAIITILTVSLLKLDPKFSYLIGYVGADIAEGVYKSIIKMKILK